MRLWVNMDVTKEDVSVSKNKEDKERVESFLSFHISAELLGPVSVCGYIAKCSISFYERVPMFI